MERVVLLLAVVVAGAVLSVKTLDAQSFTFSMEDQTVEYDPTSGAKQTFPAAVLALEDSTDPSFPTDTYGFDIAVANDPGVLTPIAAVPAGDIAQLNGGDGPSFFTVDASEGDSIYVYATFTSELATLDGEIVTLTYELNEERFLDNLDGEVTDLEFIVPSSPFAPKNRILLLLGPGLVSTSEPALDNAVITLEPMGGGERPPSLPLFLRGDADGGGSVSALLDALYILSWTFAGGSAPPCEDAADADGNGVVSALLDSLRLLSWAFAGGDPPPDPGVETCGPDPDIDVVDCAAVADACAD